MQEIKQTMVFLLKGFEVGRAPLPNGTLETHRYMLAKETGVKEFDNFLFLDKDGKVNGEGNAYTFDGKPYGKKHGEDYAEWLKTNTNL